MKNSPVSWNEGQSGRHQACLNTIHGSSYALSRRSRHRSTGVPEFHQLHYETTRSIAQAYAFFQ